MGLELKYTAISGLSMLLVLTLHAVHWLSVPMLAGAMEMQGHHHGMAIDASSHMELFTALLLLVNAAGMYFAVRQLAMVWKRRNGGFHTYICSAVSVGVLAVGIYSMLSL
jgi:hypothetical protein